jgi:2-polyprenyl-3-methyl-5-hydroxy-6-metoxy-1,4-benzoquinol methylase
MGLEEGEEGSARRKVTVREVPLDEGASLRIRVDWDVGIGGDLWTTGLDLLQHMVKNARSYSKLMRGKNVLELGSGSGLVGLAAAYLCSPASVHITDCKSHVEICQQNADENRHLTGACDVRVFELDWTDPESAKKRGLHPSYDVILATDVVYFAELYEPFIKALDMCAGPGCLGLIGVTRSDTEPAFFDALSEAGFAYYLIQGFGSNFGMFTVFRRRRRGTAKFGCAQICD